MDYEFQSKNRAVILSGTQRRIWLHLLGKILCGVPLTMTAFLFLDLFVSPSCLRGAHFVSD